MSLGNQKHSFCIFCASIKYEIVSNAVTKLRQVEFMSKQGIELYLMPSDC